MPQVIVNSSEIDVFSFTAKFDVKNLSIVFDISDTVFNGTGVTDCQGICFSVVDADGTTQHAYDWNTPDIATPSTTENPVYLGESTYTLDLSETFMYALFFQKWRIKGAIKDGNGIIYETLLTVWDLCMPDGFTDYGYVKGTFLVKLDCHNATLTAKDLTVMIYRKEEPYETTKDGTLYYPVGTIDPVTFTTTPFSNTQVYTGNYRLVNTTIALFDLGNGGIIQVEYYTANNWDFDCENNIANVLCCIQEVQSRADLNCNNAIGREAQAQLASISVPLMTGVIKELRGQDSSSEAKYIREKLRCDCGKQGVRKVSVDPQNAAVYEIVIEDAGGTTVSSEISGNTKTYTVSSRIYSVTKGDLNDQAFSIAINTQTPYTTKYVLTFDYEVMAGYILTEISGNTTLITQLNSLISKEFINLSNLNGRCVIDITASNYFLSYRVSAGSNLIESILIDGDTYTFPANTTVNDPDAIELYLNGLGLGNWEVSYSSSPSGTFINILTTENSNNPTSVIFVVGSAEVTVLFQQTTKSLIAVLQALIDYMCDITAAEIQLGTVVTVCSLSDNEASNSTLSASASQQQLNAAFAVALCAIQQSVISFTTTTCAQLKAIFIDRPSSTVDSTARFFGTNADGNCTGFNINQITLGVINAIKNNSDIFNAYCTIPACGDPTDCPDVESAVVVQDGNAIVLQSVGWSAFTDQTQTLTVRYRVVGDPTYTTVTTTLEVGADGDVTPNYTVLESPTVGESYEVYITNNCGGTGVITTVEISICPEPENLEVTYVEETSPGLTYEVLLTWEGDADGEYNVEYTVDGDTSYLVAVGSPVTGLSISIEGLEYGVTYEFRVQRVCDSSTESTWASTTFSQDFYIDYFSNRYTCVAGTCGVLDTADYVVALPDTHTPVYGDFYLPVTENGYVYELLNTPSAPGPGLVISEFHAATCNLACAPV